MRDKARWVGRMLGDARVLSDCECCCWGDMMATCFSPSPLILDAALRMSNRYSPV